MTHGDALFQRISRQQILFFTLAFSNVFSDFFMAIIDKSGEEIFMMSTNIERIGKEFTNRLCFWIKY